MQNGLKPFVVANMCDTSTGESQPGSKPRRRLHFQELVLSVSKSMPVLENTGQNVKHCNQSRNQIFRHVTKSGKLTETTLQRTLMVQTLFGSKDRTTCDSYEDDIDSFMRSRTESFWVRPVLVSLCTILNILPFVLFNFLCTICLVFNTFNSKMCIF